MSHSQVYTSPASAFPQDPARKHLNADQPTLGKPLSPHYGFCQFNLDKLSRDFQYLFSFLRSIHRLGMASAKSLLSTAMCMREEANFLPCTNRSTMDQRESGIFTSSVPNPASEHMRPLCVLGLPGPPMGMTAFMAHLALCLHRLGFYPALSTQVLKSHFAQMHCWQFGFLPLGG